MKIIITKGIPFLEFHGIKKGDVLVAKKSNERYFVRKGVYVHVYVVKDDNGQEIAVLGTCCKELEASE